MLTTDTIFSFIDELEKCPSKYDYRLLICRHCGNREAGDKRKTSEQSNFIGSSIFIKLSLNKSCLSIVAHFRKSDVNSY